MPTRYTVTEHGTLGGERSSALAVNDNGQVVGFSTTTSGATRAFLYEDGAMQDLGTLGGGDSLAYGISSNGTVVGRALNSAGEFQAFVRVPGGRLMDIPGQNATFRGPFSTATAVSKGGRVVGYRLTPGDHMVARSRTFLFTTQA